MDKKICDEGMIHWDGCGQADTVTACGHANYDTETYFGPKPVNCNGCIAIHDQWKEHFKSNRKRKP